MFDCLAGDATAVAAVPPPRRAALVLPAAARTRGAADAALIAELALTFDLEALVAEADRDPFRR